MASSTSSSQTTRKLNYDVFLSFRGEDTRKNFVDHLYYRLNQKGLLTFKDNVRLEKGQPIAPNLLQAIQESRFAVIVFSKTYASSPWCLDEVAKIMECKENLNQVVVPIFYDIEPSHVRKQTGSFEEAFAKHEENFKDKIEGWRKALTEAGSIAGHDLQGDEYNGFETECIKAVIADISKQLPPPPSVQKSLVGLELRLEEIRMKLKVWDEDVKLVLGLWGMGGIGKTTIARAAFNRFSSGFDGSCFLADVSNLARKDGLETLQKKLLSKVLKENSIDIDDVDEGIRMIKKRLEWKRVLIVLDDVDHRNQLDKLVGDGEWLCNGSRVIITTRDKHLFTQFSVVVETYEVKKLEKEKALELFSWHAFKKESPNNGFEDLATSFVAHAGGLPLALEVWGSLCGQKDQKVWESILEKVKGIRDGDVIERLRISYDGLDEECKKVFLDIVCFFRDKHQYIIEEMLNCLKSNPVANILLLIDRCLLFQSFELGEPCIHMHDLIYEMGLNIAREKRSRRWQLDDLHDEPKAVEGLLLSIHYDENISHCIEAFKHMTKLKLLIVEYEEHYGRSLKSVRGIMNYLPRSLMGLKFPFYPSSKSVRGIMNYLPNSLMVLKFPFYPSSKPFFSMEMVKLTYLDLNSSMSLLETPNFAKMPNLVNLNLSCCTKLKTIHSSIGNLTKLVKLNLNFCKNLAKLPCFNQEMKNIIHLDLSYCCSLLETPNFAMMPNLVHLNLSWCTKLKEIHPSIGNLTKLATLTLFQCNNIERIPSFNQEMENLWSLDLTSCCSLLETPNFTMTPNLEYLHLSWSKKLKEIHPSIGNLTKLVELSLDGCSNLEKIPNFNQEMKNFKYLELTSCSSLIETPNFAMMPNLMCLYLSNCKKLKEIHPSIENLTKLSTLALIGCSNLEKLPNFNQEMENIDNLVLTSCSSLLKTPIFCIMPNLECLCLLNCEKLKEIHPSIENLIKLVKSYLNRCSELEKVPNFYQLSSLSSRILHSCMRFEYFQLLKEIKYLIHSELRSLKLSV